MIVYDRFWEILNKKDISQYSLIKHHHLSASQLNRLKNNGVVETRTLDRLCNILDCEIEDICQHIKDTPPES